MVLAVLGLVSALVLLHEALVFTVYSDSMWRGTMALLVGAWVLVHRNRQAGWAKLALRYEEIPESDIHALELLK